MLPKNTSSRFAAFTLSLLIIIASCKKSSDITDTPPVPEPPVVVNDAIKVTATISGSVIDENNQPVANAAVTSDTYTGNTDAMGNFTFKNINISAANGHVTVVKAGYFKGIRSFVTSTGKNNFVKIQLIKQTLTATLTSTTGGTVSTNGAVITFPANAFVTASGAAYNGSVKVFANWIDPTAVNLPLIIPGDLRGINSSNNEYILKSYGMLGAELQDATGNSLKLAPGKTATISFPIPAALQADAPASIALWHFDEAAARWKEEGTATKNGNTYTATVDKFSFWNVDVPANFINLDARLVNSTNNLPLANTMVKITSLTTNSSAYSYTNDSGYVSGYVPKNQPLKLEVVASLFCSGISVIYTQNIGPYSANVSLGNISVTMPASQVINFTGSIKNCSNQPVTNGYLSLSLANGASTIVYTNAAGEVNFSLLYCGGNVGYNYTGVDLSTGAYSNITNGTATSNAVNLGTITACGNTINTSGVYITGYIDYNAVLWKDGVATVLTSIPVNPYRSANAIKPFVYNNDVYVLGNEEDSIATGWVSTIKLWKNGILTNITNGATYAEANDLNIYNGDIYICGYEETGGISQAKVWKNGVASIIPKDTFNVITLSSIKVVNGDVYVSGEVTRTSTTSTSRAVYWKNGSINFLTSASTGYGYARGIFVVNGDLYFAGDEAIVNGQPHSGVYWKNGIRTILTLPPSYLAADAGPIFIDNNDIYIGGSAIYNQGGSYFQNAVYWKNNSITNLTNYSTNGKSATVEDIFVKNNIVYSVGGNFGQPINYQNNVAVPLTGFTNNQDVGCYGVFVQ